MYPLFFLSKLFYDHGFRQELVLLFRQVCSSLGVPSTENLLLVATRLLALSQFSGVLVFQGSLLLVKRNSFESCRIF